MILTDTDPYDNKWYDLLEQFQQAVRGKSWNNKDIVLRKYARIAEYFESKEEYGSPYLVEDMIKSVKETSILDCDGYGRLVSFEDFSTKEVFSIEDIDTLKKFKKTHFILWYNK